jgi:GLPGLI family protein
MTTSSISEGNIEYGLEVIDNRNALLTNDMLPATMNMYFKDNKTCFNLSAFGVFSTDLITNSNDSSIMQTLSLMGKKYAVVGNRDSLPTFLKNEPTMEIKFDSKTKKIAGYTCKHAIGTFHNPDFPSFDIYYTEDIKVDNINFYSQYAPIKGVLMEFNVFRYNVFMKLTAKQVNKQDVEDIVFEAGSDYKKVSKKEMDSYFNPTN